MLSTSRQSETGNTILFLHSFLFRTTRLFLSGLASVATKRGWNVQHATPPHGASAAYIRKLISFWHPLGIVTVYSPSPDKRIPLPDPDLTVPFVCIDLDPSLLPHKHVPLPPRTGFVCCDSKALSEMAAKTLMEHDFAAYAYVSASALRIARSSRRAR